MTSGNYCPISFEINIYVQYICLMNICDWFKLSKYQTNEFRNEAHQNKNISR